MMSSVNRDEYLAALGRDSGRITEVGATAWSVRVPSCPEWTVFDLMRHVGTFHRYVSYLAALPNEATLLLTVGLPRRKQLSVLREAPMW
jgi:hypothetical protein